MDRRTTRFLGAVLLVTATALGITSVANAGQVRAAGALLGAGRTMAVVGCAADRAFDAIAVPATHDFDPGTPVLVTPSDPASLADGGGLTNPGAAALVHVHVPVGTEAGTYRVEVRASGTHHGEPAVVIDELTVRVRC